MPVEIAVALIGLIEALGVAVIGGIVQHQKKGAEAYRAKREKEEAARAEEQQAAEDRRTEFITCMYDLAFATTLGTEVLLHQAHGDKVNGNVDKALESIGKAKGACNHLLNENMAKNL